MGAVATAVIGGWNGGWYRRPARPYLLPAGYHWEVQATWGVQEKGSIYRTINQLLLL